MTNIMGMGKNRTGVGTSPIDAKALVESAEDGVPYAPGDGAALAEVRGSYVREGEPIGTVPPPTTVKGAISSAGQMLTGKQPVVLLDKLGQRLAFERTGTRLYEALLAKMEAAELPPGVALNLVRRFHDEERAHFELVTRAIEKLGGDPTAVTPSANLDGVASMGLLQVISDPRTTVLQSLHALHIAELADNDGWVMLVELARSMGQDDMVAEFSRALAEEDEHLETVRNWMKTATSIEAGVGTAAE